MSQRSRAVALSIVLAIIFAVGTFVAFRPERAWVGYGTPAAPLSLEEVELRLTESITQDGRAPPGLNVPIAWFRTPEGRTIRITLREMNFEADRITGLQFPATQKAAIVSSVDQRVYESSSSSGPILRGCDLKEIDGVKLLPGRPKVDECHGPYNKLGIDAVINVAIVTFSQDKGKILPCISKTYEREGQQGYEKCTIEKLKFGLEGILSQISSEKSPYDVLILPELATGIGGISKRDFYNQLFAVLGTKLGNSTARTQLPGEIILQVWSQDRAHDAFAETVDAVRKMIATPVEAFRELERPSRSSGWLRLVGIAGGLSLAIVGLLVSERLRATFPALRSLANAPTATNLIAWVLICFGLADSLSRLSGQLQPAWEVPFQLALGVLIVPIAAPLIKAVKSVEHSFTSSA